MVQYYRGCTHVATTSRHCVRLQHEKKANFWLRNAAAPTRPSTIQEQCGANCFYLSGIISNSIPACSHEIITYFNCGWRKRYRGISPRKQKRIKSSRFKICICIKCRYVHLERKKHNMQAWGMILRSLDFFRYLFRNADNSASLNWSIFLYKGMKLY